MTRIRRITGAALAAVFLACLANPGLAQTSPTPGPGGAADVARATLPNGLQVVVIRDPLAPVVSVWMNYLAGSDDESIEGLAHAQEHMLFRGSKTIDASQFSQSIAVTGGNFNADTENAATQFFFEVPAQDLDVALQLERSRATGVLDSQHLWDQERGAITQEVTRDNSSADYRLFDKTVRHLFAGTPYADPGLGTVASFKRVDQNDLRAFYARWYHPNNAIYVIAGDVDPQATIARVRALFGDIPAVPVPAHRSVTLSPLTPVTLRDNSSDPVVSAFVAYRVPGFFSPDYFASAILSDVLNSQRGALFDLQATGKALATFAQAQTYQQAGVSLVGSVVPVTTSGDAAVKDVEAVIDGYKTTGVPADLVEVAKRREVTQAEAARTSISGLASAWSQALAVEHRTPDDDLAGLEKVTVDDVNRVLRTYYDNATATVAIATPKDAAGSAFGSKAGEDNTIIPAANTQLPAFAKRVLADLHVPHATVAPTLQTLPNGLKLVVVPETVSKTVSLRGIVLSDPDLEDAPGKEGVESLVDALFPFGTATYDRLAYQTELDKIAATASAGRSFNLDVLSSQFDRGLDLLADDELHPAFPAAAFAIVKQQEIGQLTGTVRSPDFKAQIALVNALYPNGDPIRRYATPQSVAGVSLDDVKASYAAMYRPDLTTIVIVGDITPDHARAAVERAFGGWTASGPKPAVFEPAVKPNRALTTVVPATGRVQADVTLAEVLPIGYHDPDYAALALGDQVLTGGFYASLLFHDLREVHGYAYSVSSGIAWSQNRSVFTINFGSDLGNVGPAAKLVRDDLQHLRTHPLDAGRLQRAKALMAGSLPLGSESYDGLAAALSRYASTDRPLDFDRQIATQALAATPQSLQAAMARHIRPNDFVRVVTAPAK
jgi:zinc protease